MAFLHSPIQWHIEGRHWRNSRVTSFLYFCKKRVCHRLAQHALWELPAVHCNLTQNSSLHLLTFTFNFLHCCYRITASTYDMLDPKFIAFKQREVPHQIPQVFLKPLIYSIYQVTRTFWVAAQQPSVIISIQLSSSHMGRSLTAILSQLVWALSKTGTAVSMSEHFFTL